MLDGSCRGASVIDPGLRASRNRRCRAHRTIPESSCCSLSNRHETPIRKPRRPRPSGQSYLSPSWPLTWAAARALGRRAEVGESICYESGQLLGSQTASAPRDPVRQWRRANRAGLLWRMFEKVGVRVRKAIPCSGFNIHCKMKHGRPRREKEGHVKRTRQRTPGGRGQDFPGGATRPARDVPHNWP